MDLKTLEYMEERAGKARKLVNKIEKLKANIESLKKIMRVDFINNSYRNEFDSSTGDLTNEIKEAYLNIATNEINYLEQKLAEL
jgi:predicted RNase H-like nuclease (RuvC/YqgF family)